MRKIIQKAITGTKHEGDILFFYYLLNYALDMKLERGMNDLEIYNVIDETVREGA